MPIVAFQVSTGTASTHRHPCFPNLNLANLLFHGQLIYQLHVCIRIAGSACCFVPKPLNLPRLLLCIQRGSPRVCGVAAAAYDVLAAGGSISADDGAE